MKPNSEHFKRINAFFSSRNRAKMRGEFVAHFDYVPQTYYNKKSAAVVNSYFSGDEIVWLEKWARENGMPESLLYEPVSLPESKRTPAA